MTEEHESLPFRRRGYERDALLQSVIEASGFSGLLEREGKGNAQGDEKQRLALLPDELSHFDLERFRDRPVQAEIAAVLMVPKGEGFTSCVLIHGMGGTGKVSRSTAFLFVEIDSDFTA